MARRHPVVGIDQRPETPTVITPGTRLGSYELVAPIGVGGMGEVYRARDTTLGRDVAIKILPQTFASDPDRVASMVVVFNWTEELKRALAR